MYKKILLLDDDEDDVDIISQAFFDCGIELHSVSCTKQAFTYLDSTDDDKLPHVIIADMYLGANSGADFLAELQKIERYKDIKVVLITTNRLEKYSEKYKELGAFDYLEKPTTYSGYVQTATDIIETTIGTPSV